MLLTLLVSAQNTDEIKQFNEARYANTDYVPNKWYHAIHFNLIPLGVQVEFGYTDLDPHLMVLGRFSYHYLPNYDIHTTPIEVGLALTPDPENYNKLFVFYTGYDPLPVQRGLSWYDPSWTYGISYRHSKPIINSESSAFFWDFGYRGGLIKGEFISWQGSVVQRTVRRNRLKFGIGVSF